MSGERRRVRVFLAMQVASAMERRQSLKWARATPSPSMFKYEMQLSSSLSSSEWFEIMKKDTEGGGGELEKAE